MDAEQLAAMAGGGGLGAGGGLVVVLGAGILCVATGAVVIVLATAGGVAKYLLGEDGEGDGKKVTVSEGVPLPPLVGVGEVDVADFVAGGSLAAETF